MSVHYHRARSAPNSHTSGTRRKTLGCDASSSPEAAFPHHMVAMRMLPLPQLATVPRTSFRASWPVTPLRVVLVWLHPRLHTRKATVPRVSRRIHRELRPALQVPMRCRPTHPTRTVKLVPPSMVCQSAAVLRQANPSRIRQPGRCLSRPEASGRSQGSEHRSSNSPDQQR